MCSRLAGCGARKDLGIRVAAPCEWEDRRGWRRLYTFSSADRKCVSSAFICVYLRPKSLLATGLSLTGARRGKRKGVARSGYRPTNRNYAAKMNEPVSGLPVPFPHGRGAVTGTLRFGAATRLARADSVHQNFLRSTGLWEHLPTPSKGAEPATSSLGYDESEKDSGCGGW